MTKKTVTHFGSLLTGMSAILTTVAYAADNHESDVNVSVKTGEVVSVAVGSNVTSQINIGTLDGASVNQKDYHVEVHVGRVRHITSGDGISIVTIGPIDDWEDDDWEDDDWEDDDWEDDDDTEQEGW